jgi:hypothetical protein
LKGIPADAQGKKHMTSVLIRLFLVAVVFAVLMVSGVDARDHRGTIVLVSGEKYEDVTFDIWNKFCVVTVRSGADRRYISYHEVKSIFDAGGVDITAKLIGETGEFTAEECDSRILGTIKESIITQQAWRAYWSHVIISATISGGFGSTLRSNAIDASGSVGEIFSSFALNGFIPAGKGFSLRLGIERTYISPSLNGQLTSSDPSIQINGQEYHADASQYYLAIQKNFVSAYLYLGSGWIKHTFEVDYSARDTETGEQHNMQLDFTQRNLMLVFGWGDHPKLYRNLRGDYGADFRVVFARGDNMNWYGCNGPYLSCELRLGLALPLFAL